MEESKIKKILAVLIIVAGLGLNEGNVYAEEGILELMRDANSNSTFQENGRIVAYRADTYDVENGVHSAYAYLDPDRVVYECEEYIEINEKGDVYGFKTDDKKIYRYLFVDDSEIYREIEITGYIQNPDEVFVEKIEQGGDLIVHTMDEDPDSVAALADTLSFYGYEVPETIMVMNEYILDPETYEIKKYSVYVNMGGEDILMIENNRIEDPDVYEVAPELTDTINAEDSRVVTVIADPGTDDETIYKQTIARGCSIIIYPSMDHPNLYFDEACTQPFTGGVDPNEDMTVYTIRE